MLLPKRFKQEVAKQLGFYVYRLVDPRNGNTFYVGKGKGDRVFSHIHDALSPKQQIAHLKKHLSKDESSTSPSDLSGNLKLKTIQDIQSSGLEVIPIIHRHGMSQSTAFAVEAALIDAYPNLTNKVAGHESAETGAATLPEVIQRYSANEFKPKHPLLAINVGVSYQRENRDLYDAVRYAWVVDLTKVEGRLVLAHTAGLVKGVYKPDNWYSATDPKLKVPSGLDENRWGFVGKKADKAIWNQYVGKRIPAQYRKRGAANPVRYIDP